MFKIQHLLVVALATASGIAACEKEPPTREPPSQDQRQNKNPRPAADWPMHRGGPELNGRAEEAAPAEAALRWTFKAGSPVKGGSAIAGDRVYFGDDKG